MGVAVVAAAVVVAEATLMILMIQTQLPQELVQAPRLEARVSQEMTNPSNIMKLMRMGMYLFLFLPARAMSHRGGMKMDFGRVSGESLAI